MIQTENLSKRFNDFLAVDDVQLDVESGQILALLGQNGAGKTTTIRMLTGLLRPTRGWARVAGHDVVKEPNRVRASVGVLAEQHGLYTRMTAVEYLDFFGRVYRLDAEARKKRSEHLLEYFGLADVAKRRIGEYSKGMKQRLGMASVLIKAPNLAILDEPTTGIDIGGEKTIYSLLYKFWQERGLTILMITHEINIVYAYATNVLCLYKRGICMGPPRKILTPQLLEKLYGNEVKFYIHKH